MKYKIMADGVVNIAENLSLVQKQISCSVNARSKDLPQIQPTLVAVTKTKPLVAIRKAYDAGQRHFGENYLKELLIKSTNSDLAELCPDIKWHYIGMFQTKMATNLLRVPRLYMLETLTSSAQADAINSRWKSDEPLEVLVQVNTSGEENKNGLKPDACLGLARHVIEKCSRLHFGGLMTIGAVGHDYTQGPNPDFELLRECRSKVCRELGLGEKEVALSMGMSADFEEAIKAGSTHVRVGSSIFGARDYPAEKEG